MSKQESQVRLGKFLYGALFVVGLPLVLVYWSSVLDQSITWPVPNLPFVAVVSGLVGGGLILKAMLDLYIYGHGLPMNAYPPKQLVTRGIYAWFAHPIYLGAVLLSLGLALWFRSSSGLYIVTPVLALMSLSLLFGYERLAMARLFGDSLSQYRPLFSLPVSSEEKAAWTKKIAMLIRIFLPWIVVGNLIDYARCAEGCTGLMTRAWEIQNGMALLWTIPYLYTAVRLLIARSESNLRQAAIAGTMATALGTYLNLILPIFGFNVIDPQWSLIIASIATVIVAVNYRAVGAKLQSLCEWVANSRRDWLFANGNFRIISHSLFSGFGAAVGLGIASYIIGNSLAVLVCVVCVLIGGALFAQLSWGSKALLRPFGYWGGILGGISGTFLVYLLFQISFSQFALGTVLCAPFALAIGRWRCLVQGCCHGVVTNNKDLAIRVWQPQSRVVFMSGLKGVYILNTPLFSVLCSLLLGFLLWSMWLTHNLNSWLIIGMYAILTGIERFTEDAYRGETQTKMVRGLRENQWVAIVALIIGILITLIPTSLPSNTTGIIDLFSVAIALVAGLFAAFAMSMDFPKSNKRFSRLSG